MEFVFCSPNGFKSWPCAIFSKMLVGGFFEVASCETKIITVCRNVHPVSCRILCTQVTSTSREAIVPGNKLVRIVLDLLRCQRLNDLANHLDLSCFIATVHHGSALKMFVQLFTCRRWVRSLCW